MPPAVADFFGVKVRKVKISEAKKRKLLTELKGIISGLKILEKIKPPFATRAEWVDALDLAMKPFLDPPFRKIHFADYLRRSYLSLVEAPLETRLFAQTNYKKFCNEIDLIACELFRTQRQALADKLFYEVGESPDVGIMGQALLVHVPKIAKVLSKTKSKFRRYDVDRLVRIYSELSGYYEKSLRMVVGMLEAVEGREPSYSALSKQKLSAHLNRIVKSHPVLASDFGIVVRNSIAHGSNYFHYNDQTIDFHDFGKKLTWGFRDLFKRCRKLSALATATMMSYFIFQARRWQNTWKAYRNEKSTIHARS